MTRAGIVQRPIPKTQEKKYYLAAHAQPRRAQHFTTGSPARRYCAIADAILIVWDSALWQ
jgi:hypothetical protein